jgi:ABC-type lipoprotein export system ATPase subunit
MITFYLSLINNKITRMYLILLMIGAIINTIIFELIHLMITNKLIIWLITGLSFGFFYLHGLLKNLKDNYVLNYLYASHGKKMIDKLSKSDKTVLNQLQPFETTTAVSNGNYIIENLLLLIENGIYLGVKLLVTILMILLIKPKFISLLVMTIIIMAFNIRILCKRNQNTNSFDHGLYNYEYYLIHGWKSCLINHLDSQLKSCIKNINIRNTTSFVYLNYALVSIYIYLGFNALTLEDKFYLIIYARNSSYLFSLIQIISSHYENIIGKMDTVDKILTIPSDKTITSRLKMQEPFVITINKLEYNGKKIIGINWNHNSKVLIYGKSGMGKSTLLNILKSITKPTLINVELNGSAIDLDQIENNIMLVRYDTFRYFNDKLINIITDTSGYNNELFYYLMKVTELDKIFTDPNTMINDKQISSGQMKRLILIKVFYDFFMQGKKILLLDELDNGIHHHLFQKILDNLFQSEYYRNKMILIVSHNTNLITEPYFTSTLLIDDNLIFKKN